MTDPGQAAQFEAMLRQRRAGFLAELPERCDHLEDAILALEADPAAEGVYEELYRNVHSLKGSGGTFGIAIVTSICHQFETFLAEHHGRYGQALGSTSLGYIDLLRQAGELAAQAKPDFLPLEAALERLRASVLQSREPVLVAESSGMMKAFYQQALTGLPVQLTFVENGLHDDIQSPRRARGHHDMILRKGEAGFFGEDLGEFTIPSGVTYKWLATGPTGGMDYASHGRAKRHASDHQRAAGWILHAVATGIRDHRVDDSGARPDDRERIARPQLDRWGALTHACGGITPSMQ